MIRIRNIEELEAERERQYDEWLEAGDEADDFKLDLDGADFDGANLRGADLREADLRGADLAKTDLTGADLRWAIFYPDQIGKSVIGSTMITKSQWDKLARVYNQEFMACFNLDIYELFVWG